MKKKEADFTCQDRLLVPILQHGILLAVPFPVPLVLSSHVSHTVCLAHIQLGDKRVACFSLADHFDYWAAGPERPGIWLVSPGQHRSAALDFIRRQISRACEEGGADLVFVSIHWGPNWGWKPRWARGRTLVGTPEVGW